ncbi:aromatic prenyltransferase [Streptomyces sp. NPDC003691]
MSGNAEVAAVCAVIEKAARLLDVTCAQDRMLPVLDTYRETFAHESTVVAYRMATGRRHTGELDCRFTVHPEERDPYARALSGGLLAETGRPVDTLLHELRDGFPVDTYGIDFGVVGGFKKIYAFFTPDGLQELPGLAALPGMPPALAANSAFFARHGLADRVGVIGVDYAHRTVNVYFNEVPAECFAPETMVEMSRELGLARPSEDMLRLGREAFGLYATLSWESPGIERLCFAVTTTDPDTLPVRIDPGIERFVRGFPYGGAERKFVYGAALAPGGEYYKIELHDRWRAGAMDFI